MEKYRLKELRIGRGYSQGAIAEVINLSRESYNMYETGARDPHAADIQRLAKFYDISADYILGLIFAVETLSDRNKTVVKDEVKEG